MDDIHSVRGGDASSPGLAQQQQQHVTWLTGEPSSSSDEDVSRCSPGLNLASSCYTLSPCATVTTSSGHEGHAGTRQHHCLARTRRQRKSSERMKDLAQIAKKKLWSDFQNCATALSRLYRDGIELQRVTYAGFMPYGMAHHPAAGAQPRSQHMSGDAAERNYWTSFQHGAASVALFYKTALDSIDQILAHDQSVMACNGTTAATTAMMSSMLHLSSPVGCASTPPPPSSSLAPEHCTGNCSPQLSVNTTCPQPTEALTGGGRVSPGNNAIPGIASIGHDEAVTNSPVPLRRNLLPGGPSRKRRHQSSGRVNVEIDQLFADALKVKQRRRHF